MGRPREREGDIDTQKDRQIETDKGGSRRKRGNQKRASGWRKERGGGGLER